MELKLINRIEVDGEWFIVELDGKKAYFLVKPDGSNREEKREEATTRYNLLKENKGIWEETILSDTI